MHIRSVSLEYQVEAPTHPPLSPFISSRIHIQLPLLTNLLIRLDQITHLKPLPVLIEANSTFGAFPHFRHVLFDIFQ